MREIANSEKREVTRKSEEFKATDSDFNRDQIDVTIPQDDLEMSFTCCYTAIDVWNSGVRARNPGICSKKYVTVFKINYFGHTYQTDTRSADRLSRVFFAVEIADGPENISTTFLNAPLCEWPRNASYEAVQ